MEKKEKKKKNQKKKKEKKIESIRIYRQCPWWALDADLRLRFFSCVNGLLFVDFAWRGYLVWKLIWKYLRFIFLSI